MQGSTGVTGPSLNKIVALLTPGVSARHLLGRVGICPGWRIGARAPPPSLCREASNHFYESRE
eukprot:5223003-Amphidinium_carterae.1